MFSRAIRSVSLDQWAIGLSGLCLAHCLTTALLIAMFSAAGSFFAHSAIHEVGLGLATMLAGTALFRGYRSHGMLGPLIIGCYGLGLMLAAIIMPHTGLEAGVTMLGVMLVALAHDLNRRLA